MNTIFKALEHYELAVNLLRDYNQRFYHSWEMDEPIRPSERRALDQVEHHRTNLQRDVGLSLENLIQVIKKARDEEGELPF